MPGDIYRHVWPGQPIAREAARENAWTDAARLVNQQRGAGSKSLVPGFDYGLVLVKNTTNETLPQFGVVGLEESRITDLEKDVVLEEFKQSVVFKGRKPVWPDDLGNFAVMTQRTAKNDWGQALLAGRTQCKVYYDSTADSEDRKYADMTEDGVDYLTAMGAGAARVKWREGGEGEQWAIVQLGMYTAPVLIGKTTTTHNKGATASVNVFYPASYTTAKGSEFGTATFSAQVYNRFADLGSDVKVFIQWILNGWELVNAEC